MKFQSPVTVPADALMPLCYVLRGRQGEQLREYLQLIKSKNAGYCTITIDTPHKPRTTGDKSQNRHLNGHVQQIAQETGNPFEVVKMEIKHRAISMGYPILYKPDGTPRTDLWGRVMGISEADSSTSECALLIETAHRLAAELGIFLQEN